MQVDYKTRIKEICERIGILFDIDPGFINLMWKLLSCAKKERFTAPVEYTSNDNIFFKVIDIRGTIEFSSIGIWFEFNWKKAFDKNENWKWRIVRIKVMNILGKFVVMWMINTHIDYKMKANGIGKFKSNSWKYSTVIELRKNQKRI
jgi:hypothetical protein